MSKRTNVKVGYNSQYGKNELDLISDADMYWFFEKVLEKRFLTFLTHIIKPTVSIQNLMTQNKN